MSRRVLADVEESISREVRRITFDDKILPHEAVLRDAFDPFTGSLIQVPIEASYYDSSADTNSIQYPHFFIRLMKSREDRFTGRVVPEYGFDVYEPSEYAPKAYAIIATDTDGLIATAGNQLTTSLFKVRTIQPGMLLRPINGHNRGTYTISSVTVSSPSIITVSNILVANLPLMYANHHSHVVKFSTPVDLHTVQINDILIDSTAGNFYIREVNLDRNELTLTGSPNLLAGGHIERSGNVFKVADPTDCRFLILDPSQPVEQFFTDHTEGAHSRLSGISPEIPLDLFYMVRIDSKQRDTHRDILNRIWEEFNPPRTALPFVERSSDSVEESLVYDAHGKAVHIKDTSGYHLGDNVVIINDFHPTKRADGHGFERPFKSIVTSIYPSHPKDIQVKKHLVIHRIEDKTLTLGYIDFSSTAIGSDLIGYVSRSPMVPADLRDVEPGMIVKFMPKETSGILPFKTVILSVDRHSSQVTVAHIGDLQRHQLVDIDISSVGTLVLADEVPDMYKVSNNSKIISDTEFRLFMFHFVDHVTRDIEGSQYWVHEFSFWVQIWVKKLEHPQLLTAIDEITTEISTANSGVIVTDP